MRNVLLSLTGGSVICYGSHLSQVIQSCGSSLSTYGLFFLGTQFVWAFNLMFLFSGRAYWQELIESIVWAHNKLKVVVAAQSRALSISITERSCCRGNGL